MAETPSRPQAGDPADAVDAARELQRGFERERRRHFRRGGWPSRGCDEHIGRFCLEHDGDEGWVPSPDPAPVAEARLALIAALDSLAASAPDDLWITGQRIRYRLEAGEPGEALAIARSCTVGWRCEAFEGFVLHRQGSYEKAGRAFDGAIAGMDAETRCAWTDAERLLSGDDRRAYRRLRCGAARDGFERRLWHLSDPAWSIAGQERRTEHLTRRVWAALQADAASGYGVSWGGDIEELTIRYGWPEGWDVAWRRDPGIRTERVIQSHRSPEAQRWIAAGLDRGPEIGPTWELDPDRPRSQWGLPEGPVRALALQVGAFRRGARRLIVARADRPAPASEPSAPAPGPSASALGPSVPCDRVTALFLSTLEAVTAHAERAGPGPLSLLAPEGDSATLIGVETRCRQRTGIRRARLLLPPGDNLLSDLILVEPGESLPGTLDAALPAMRGTNRVRPGEPVVVFWEWYGAEAQVATTLALERQNVGFWRKALEWAGLATRGNDRTGLRWLDPGAGRSVARSVRLDLPDLPPGDYRLTLQVQSAQGGTVVSTRDLVVGR